MTTETSKNGSPISLSSSAKVDLATSKQISSGLSLGKEESTLEAMANEGVAKQGQDK